MLLKERLKQNNTDITDFMKFGTAYFLFCFELYDDMKKCEDNCNKIFDIVNKISEVINVNEMKMKIRNNENNRAIQL